MRVLLIVLIFTLSSCASYVQSLHKQIDNESRPRNGAQKRYAKNQKNRRGGIHNPVTLGGAPSGNTRKNVYPHVRRDYNAKGTRRYKASDLVDNQSDGSLWSGKNNESFLFVNNNLRKKGDIVIVEVMKQLKDRIQEELKRNFPERPKKGKKKKGSKAATEAVAETPPPAQQDNPDQVYDKISTNVVEQINQDYVLLRGRKEVMYKKFKRYFEFQAIASQKDISSRDSITSIKLLEPKINVLRY